MNLPDCPYCGSNDYQSSGSRLSTVLSQRSFVCLTCDALAEHLEAARQEVVTFFTYGHQYGALQKGEGDLPTAYTEWANKVLLPTWRDRRERLEQHENAEWRAWLSEVFYKQFPDLRKKEGFTDRQIRYHDCPPEAQQLMDDQFHKGDHHSVPKQQGTYHPLPPELAAPVYPPRAPEVFPMFYRSGDDWREVDPNYSAGLTPPEDPILRRNREMFDRVFDKVSEGLNRRPIIWEHAENQYGGIQPWFTFQLNDCTFTVGWRKRVISIQVESETGIPTEAIRRLAMDRDNVTYCAYGPEIHMTAEWVEENFRKENTATEELIQQVVESWKKMHPNGKMERSGGYRNTRPIAHKIEVHAWGEEKLVEYLITLGRTSESKEAAA